MEELIVTPPERCIACGLKTKKMKEKGHTWIMVKMPKRGLALFSCSKCHSVYMCTEALHNVKVLAELQNRKVQVVSDLSQIGQVQDN